VQRLTRARRKALVVFVGAALAAVAVGAASGQAKAALPPVSVWIQSCSTDGGVAYINDGNWEDEDDCEASDAVLADPSEFGYYVENLCIAGKTYLYADDDPASDFVAFLTDEGYSAAEGACKSATPPPPGNVFLCYSSTQTNPGVWPVTQAAALMAAGYWSPYAVAGNVDGGTNVGGFHLSCNLVSGQAVTQGSVTTDGSPAGADATDAVKGVPGWYPLAG
jgi:hypothetical protein